MSLHVSEISDEPRPFRWVKKQHDDWNTRYLLQYDIDITMINKLPLINILLYVNNNNA